jgi:FixJ family two-component response regulator
MMPAEPIEEPTVFIVDDDTGMRESIAAIIEISNLHAESFASAEAFLSGYDRSRHGCLVADIGMPGMSGVELHETLVREGIQIPTIFITGYLAPDVTEKDRREGVVAALQKPFSPQELLDLIRHAAAMLNRR